MPGNLLEEIKNDNHSLYFMYVYGKAGVVFMLHFYIIILYIYIYICKIIYNNYMTLYLCIILCFPVHIPIGG